MTLAIGLYALALACGTCLVAAGLEHLAARWGRPRRMIWMLAMLTSILLPPALLLVASTRPAAQQLVATSLPEVPAMPLVRDEQHASGSAGGVAGSDPAPLLAPVPARNSSWRLPQPDAHLLLRIWASVSGLLLAGLVVLTSLQQRYAKSWTRTLLLDQEVLVSDETGPALIGVLRPRVVVPRWLLDESRCVQALILEHERQHACARDPLLLRAGLLLAILVPWNLPLWWQWSRLRLAIEMDCDARVLHGGADAVRYGEVLLDIVRRASFVPVGVVAMSEPVSALERRIRALLSEPRRLAFPAMLGASAMAAFGATLMVQVRTPALPVHAAAASRSVDAAQPDTGLADARGPAMPVGASEGADEPPVGGEAFAARQVQSSFATVAAEDPQLPRLLPPAAHGIPGHILRLLATRYPEVVTGPRRSGITEVALVLKADGTLYRSEIAHPTLQQPNGSAEGLEWVIPRDGGRAITAMLKPGSELPGGAMLQTAVSLRYLDGYDATRSSELVQAAMMATRPELFLPAAGELVNRVTAFMTDDGQIDRLYSEPKHRTSLQPVPPVDLATWSPIFEPLGLKPEQLGAMGMIRVHAQPEDGRLVPASSAGADAADRRWVVVRFAWPRRAGEPAGGWQVGARQKHPDDFDAQAAQAIVQHYLPEVFEPQPPVDPSARPLPDVGIPAVALDSGGQVLLATRLPSHHGMSPAAVRALQGRLAESANLGRFVARPVRNSNGAGGSVLFAWDMRSSQEKNQ